MATVATDQKLGMHDARFAEWGAVPKEILYDRIRTIWSGTDERGEIVWNAIFLDCARYGGFKPRLCRPYRAQTKRKVESVVKYLCHNFLCGLQGREPADLNGEVARLGSGGGQPASPWDYASTGAAALGRRSVRHAAGERSPAPIHT